MNQSTPANRPASANRPIPVNRPIALRAAADALANVGVTEEGGENRGKWVEIYQRATGNKPGDPWCASFVRYRFEAAARALGLTLPPAMPDSGWSPAYWGWAQGAGIWLPVQAAQLEPHQVRAGDLACFWFAAKGRIAHIGIVVEPGKTWGAVTVEGNTGPERGEEVNREGDGVYRKLRDWSELGARGGFVRINF